MANMVCQFFITMQVHAEQLVVWAFTVEEIEKVTATKGSIELLNMLVEIQAVN